MSALAHPREPAFTFDAFDDGWTLGNRTEPCVICGRPALCRDPDRRPRHRVDCAGAAIPTRGAA